MSEIDYSEIARRMFLNVRETRAFRMAHGSSVPGLLQADDDYRNGGPIEDFRTAIETACRERHDLAPQIRRVFAWADYEGATDEIGG